MGLIIDTSVLITAERKVMPIAVLVQQLQSVNVTQTVLSAMSVVEFTHGIYLAKMIEQRDRRQNFLDELLLQIDVAPVTLAIARLAGQIQGEQAATGNVIATEDIVIGATALHFGFEVATHNVKHFERIPGLRVITPSL